MFLIGPLSDRKSLSCVLLGPGLEEEQEEEEADDSLSRLPPAACYWIRPRFVVIHYPDRLDIGFKRQFVMPINAP